MVDSVHPGASTQFLERRIEELKRRGPIDPPGKPPHDGGMDDEWRKRVEERLGALEKTLEKVGGTVEGLRVAASVVGIGFALLSALTFYTLTRVDALSGKVGDEFRTLRTDMKADAAALRHDLTATTTAIANAVTAARQVPTQVILVPAQQPQSAPSPQP